MVVSEAGGSVVTTKAALRRYPAPDRPERLEHRSSLLPPPGHGTFGHACLQGERHATQRLGI